MLLRTKFSAVFSWERHRLGGMNYMTVIGNFILSWKKLTPKYAGETPAPPENKHLKVRIIYKQRANASFNDIGGAPGYKK